MRRFIIMFMILALVAGALVQPAEPASARSYTRWAYYVPDDPRSYRSLSAHHAYLDIVAPDAWRIQPNGSITSRLQPQVVRQMRRWGLRVMPMVTKYSWGDRMHAFLASPALRGRAARTLAGLVAAGDFAGIHIDFENIERRDSAALEAFVADIAVRLRGDGRLVTMALPARTASLNSFPAFNYARLGANLDLVVVMAYDHGYAGGRPAPVAPLAWVRDVAAYTRSQIPRGKILLGIPWYGYDWNRTTRRPARYVGFAEVAGIDGQHAFDAGAQAPSLRYVANGRQHEVWYENARSVGAKLQVVIEQDLAGWAAWRLGYDDPAIWGLINPRR